MKQLKLTASMLELAWRPRLLLPDVALEVDLHQAGAINGRLRQGVGHLVPGDTSMPRYPTEDDRHPSVNHHRLQTWRRSSLRIG